MIPIVSFYTTDTPYFQEAQDMQSSAIEVGLGRFYLYPVESRGSWEANCQIKAEVLLDAARKLKEPFLYVDADARFNQYPDLFDLDWSHYDIGIHYFKGTELLSGTIWLNYTPNTIALLLNWIQINKHMPTMWDQKTLERAIQMQAKLNILHLPPEYTWIFDLSKKHYQEKKPVITHHQASRKYKREIK